ncbi:MAG: hypothetical protein H6651_20635 [Ardenticatenales bacterium]|nr:hypothetical protein [Ardenticatenales bacterium]
MKAGLTPCPQERRCCPSSIRPGATATISPKSHLSLTSHAGPCLPILAAHLDRPNPTTILPLSCPYLEKSLDLSRRVANCFQAAIMAADRSVDESDLWHERIDVSRLLPSCAQSWFRWCRTILPPAPADDGYLKQHFPEDEQHQFGEMIIKRFGYDFEHFGGRIKAIVAAIELPIG